MPHAHRLRGSVALLLVASALAVPALAGPKDSAAQKLDKQAMDEDYLNVRFADAEDKLNKAIKECGDSGCDAKLKAKIYVHLGIIQVNGGKKADAVKSFAAALKVDSGVTPEKDFTSPDVEKAFAEAKGQKGGDDTKGGDTKGGDTKGGDDKAEPSSDLKHDAVTEAPVNTPLPIWVGAEDGVKKFFLNYKPFGAEWTKIEMKRVGRGFGAEIPCKDVSVSGTLRYYITAIDSDGSPVGAAGSKKQPYEVKIANKISGDPPSFPGKDPPQACKGKGDCPPGLKEAGCESSALSYGSKCTGPGQCSKGDGLACIDGTCQPGSEGDSDDDAGGEDGPAKKNWFSFSLQVDEAFVNGGSVCTADNAKTGNWICFKSGEKQYNPKAASDAGRKNFGTVSGAPFALGTMRALVGYDRLLAPNMLLGARIGYAFYGGGPAVGATKFQPLHAEARFTYYIGKGVMSRPGVRPYVYAGGGMAQVDGKVPGVPVSNDDPTASKGITVDAYRKMGTTFAGAGGGIVYAINKKGGVILDLKGNLFFGTSGMSVAQTIGYVQGF